VVGQIESVLSNPRGSFRYFGYRSASEPYQNDGNLVGAVGIENTNARDSMDFRGTRGSATSLKRNGKERKGNPIAPLTLPSFLSSTAFPSLWVLIAASNGKVGFGQNFCGTDGKPMPHALSRCSSPRKKKGHRVLKR
jgi:hypothetical protein